MSQRSLAKTLWYEWLKIICRLLGVVVFRIRCFGREHVPAEGGALVLSNHQSHLDPVLVGLAADRRLNYLARDTLFKILPFRLLIQSLDAIPIDREGMGLSGIKETLRRLKRDEMVLIFPEGTRTRDGRIAPLKPGFCSLARRARVPLLPVAIDGAYRAFPRTSKFPRPARIAVFFGPPITPDEIAGIDDAALVALAQQRIEECHRLAVGQISRPVDSSA